MRRDTAQRVRGAVDAVEFPLARVRQRVPLLFVDGGPQTEPIPPEAWPEFHQVALAPDREAAVRELAARLLGGGL